MTYFVHKMATFIGHCRFNPFLWGSVDRIASESISAVDNDGLLKVSVRFRCSSKKKRFFYLQRIRGTYISGSIVWRSHRTFLSNHRNGASEV